MVIGLFDRRSQLVGVRSADENGYVFYPRIFYQHLIRAGRISVLNHLFHAYFPNVSITIRTYRVKKNIH